MPEIITGPPVTGEDFYDRQELIQDIWMQLKFGSILFVAPRRFGKTSTMLHLRDNPQPDYHLIFLDAEWLESPTQFIVEVIAEMVRSLQGFRRVLRGVAGFPEGLLRFVQDTISNIEVAEFKIGLREQIDQEWHERGKVLLKLAEQLDGTVLGDLENDFYLELQDDKYRFHTKVLRDWWVRFYGFE